MYYLRILRKDIILYYIKEGYYIFIYFVVSSLFPVNNLCFAKNIFSIVIIPETIFVEEKLILQLFATEGTFLGDFTLAMRKKNY